MPSGTRSCPFRMAPACQAPQMRAVPRPAPATQTPPAAPPPAVGSPAAAPWQPDLMAQVAWLWALLSATAGIMRLWGFSGGSNAKPSRPDITYQEHEGTQSISRLPRVTVTKTGWEGAQDQGDRKLGEGFSEVLRQEVLLNGLV
uniref:Uncharacterized protein n=1 Tax=Myotis lucifugus TaxID=59463 RepID=G1Q048_MYOLU